MAYQSVLVTLPAGQFVDLYAATSTTVGSVLFIDNNYADSVHLIAEAVVPSTLDSVPYTTLARGEQAQNDEGDPGAFAISLLVSTKINVFVEV